MSFSKIISRSDAAVLIPEPISTEIQNALPHVSVAMSLMRRVPMSSKTERQPVIDSLPEAYWVQGDTGLKQTTGVSWADRVMTAEELAVIVPISEAVLADMEFDAWAMVRPLIVDAIARKLDAATLFSVDKPASWPDGIAVGAADAGQEAAGPPVDSINDALSILETEDVAISGVAARGSVRGAIRQALASLGGATAFQGAPQDLWGYRLVYPSPTLAWPSGLQAIVGDFNAAIVGVRQDLTYKVITDGVISDATGKVVLNLPQQDSVALRVVARYAFQVAEVLTDAGGGNVRAVYPFAVAEAGAPGDSGGGDGDETRAARAAKPKAAA